MNMNEPKLIIKFRDSCLFLLIVRYNANNGASRFTNRYALKKLTKMWIKLSFLSSIINNSMIHEMLNYT